MHRMTAEQYRGLANQKAAPGKYGNKRVREDGHTFGSQAEYARYKELRLLQRAGQITALEVHPRYPLEVNGRRITVYEADFSFRENGRLVVTDTKGVETPAFKIKAELFRALYPDADFRVEAV